MDYLQVHQALREVRDLKRKILEKQKFSGYSGRARAIAGCFALSAAALLTAGPWTPLPYDLMFLVWGLVFVAAFTLNFGALLYWFLAEGRRDVARLGPAAETIPVWLAGGVITLALWRNGQYDLQFGIWMCLFGLAQWLSRAVLPRGVTWIGSYYLVCGFCCLLWSDGLFQHPWIMGLIFFLGEFAGGLVFHFGNAGQGVASFFGLPSSRSESSR